MYPVLQIIPDTVENLPAYDPFPQFLTSKFHILSADTLTTHNDSDRALKETDDKHSKRFTEVSLIKELFAEEVTV